MMHYFAVIFLLTKSIIFLLFSSFATRCVPNKGPDACQSKVVHSFHEMIHSGFVIITTFRLECPTFLLHDGNLSSVPFTSMTCMTSTQSPWCRKANKSPTFVLFASASSQHITCPFCRRSGLRRGAQPPCIVV